MQRESILPSSLEHRHDIADDGVFERLPIFDRSQSIIKRIFFRVVLAILMLTCTVIGWIIVQQIENKNISNGMDKLRESIEARWSETNLRDLQALRLLCEDIDSGHITDAPAFVAQSSSISRNSDCYEGIYWLSSESTILAGMSLGNGSPEDVLPADADSDILAYRRRHNSSGNPIVGTIYQGAFGRQLALLYFPLVRNSGTVAAVIRIDQLMDHFVDNQLRELAALDFVHNGQLIYRSGDYLVDRDSSHHAVARLNMLDHVWLCQITPSSKFTRQYRTNTGILIICAGIIGCVVAGGSLLAAMKRKWQLAMLERSHLQVIDIISNLSRGISTQHGELQHPLRNLLESARELTACDAVAIYTLTPDHQSLIHTSSYGDVNYSTSVRLDELALDALAPVLGGVLQSFSQLDRASFSVLRLFNNQELAGGLIAPLELDRVMGVIIFGSRTAEKWSDVRQSLARLCACMAAGLLSDETLHLQMREAMSVQEKLSQRREMMLSLLGEIFKAGSIDGTLAHIAQASPRSLGVEACVVALRTKRVNEMEIVAATGELGVRHFGVRISLSGEYVLRMNRPDSAIVIDLADVNRSGLARLNESWLAAIAVVPMIHSTGRHIGCMLLMSSGKSGFTDDQLDLARVLAARAAAAIETAQLNQQIRRDAESRAMLLRELNHRVKNNLAGIVGLLSMSSGMEMPDNVRRWLDRITERIGNIARAHELFSGGISAVSLSQLIEQVIPSLAVVKPPGVHIVKDLGDREIWLKTSQAVSLAMIIHELCYNSIVHGLGARGTLTIKATRGKGRKATLEIIDDGTANTPVGAPPIDEDRSVATIAPPAMSTGMGLRLVKGLVGRELRGRFSMTRRSEGGTVVSVDFPLERDEGDIHR